MVSSWGNKLSISFGYSYLFTAKACSRAGLESLCQTQHASRARFRAQVCTSQRRVLGKCWKGWVWTSYLERLCAASIPNFAVRNMYEMQMRFILRYLSLSFAVSLFHDSVLPKKRTLLEEYYKMFFWGRIASSGVDAVNIHQEHVIRFSVLLA